MPCVSPNKFGLSHTVSTAVLIDVHSEFESVEKGLSMVGGEEICVMNVLAEGMAWNTQT